MSNLFNYIIEYITDKNIQNFLTYIVYYFTNPKMILPANIESFNSQNTRLNMVKDKKLFELLEFIFEKTKHPEILIKLFNLLSIRISELKK